MDKEKYYKIPEDLKVQRFNLKERPGQTIRVEQPSGQLAVTFFDKDYKFPHVVTSLPDEKTLVLVVEGRGKIIKGDEEFNLENNPAVFLVDKPQVQLVGDFTGWIVRLRETQPTQGLPATDTEITQRILSKEELVGNIRDPRFPNGTGEVSHWVLGHWNSISPISVAYEGGGVGSLGDDGVFDLEDQVVEIQLTTKGRLFHRALPAFELGGAGNRTGSIFGFPARAGDISLAYPGSVITQSRYSGNYKGFTLKWVVNPGEILDPSRKKEIKI